MIMNRLRLNPALVGGLRPSTIIDDCLIWLAASRAQLNFSEAGQTTIVVPFLLRLW